MRSLVTIVVLFLLSISFCDSKRLAISSLNSHYERTLEYSAVISSAEAAQTTLHLRGGAYKYKKKRHSFKSKVFEFIRWTKDLLLSEIKKYSKPLSKPRKTSRNLNIGANDASIVRIQKEIEAFIENPPDNCDLKVGKSSRLWVITLTGVKGTPYEGETYRLRMTFPKDYPTKPPSVYFMSPAPKHQHVYTNGDICLSILGRDWRPTFTAQSIVICILSMLSSAKDKQLPQDNALHADQTPGQQQHNWMYHDDRC